MQLKIGNNKNTQSTPFAGANNGAFLCIIKKLYEFIIVAHG